MIAYLYTDNCEQATKEVQSIIKKNNRGTLIDFQNRLNGIPNITTFDYILSERKNNGQLRDIVAYYAQYVSNNTLAQIHPALATNPSAAKSYIKNNLSNYNISRALRFLALSLNDEDKFSFLRELAEIHPDKALMQIAATAESEIINEIDTDESYQNCTGCGGSCGKKSGEYKNCTGCAGSCGGKPKPHAACAECSDNSEFKNACGCSGFSGENGETTNESNEVFAHKGSTQAQQINKSALQRDILICTGLVLGTLIIGAAIVKMNS